MGSGVKRPGARPGVLIPERKGGILKKPMSKPAGKRSLNTSLEKSRPPSGPTQGESVQSCIMEDTHYAIRSFQHCKSQCATKFVQRSGSSVEILGHSEGGVTYRHYAHRAPLAFKAIMTLPQPLAFTALSKGFDGQCPCCRRRFADADG